MSRPYPRRPRKRKGHGPPRRHRGPRLDGFTPFGLGRIHDRLLPDVRGPARRTLFNELADRSSFLLALGFGAAGFGAGGPAVRSSPSGSASPSCKACSSGAGSSAADRIVDRPPDPGHSAGHQAGGPGIAAPVASIERPIRGRQLPPPLPVPPKPFN